jgi:hypothetical protein
MRNIGIQDDLQAEIFKVIKLHVLFIQVSLLDYAGEGGCRLCRKSAGTWIWRHVDRAITGFLEHYIHDGCKSARKSQP